LEVFLFFLSFGGEHPANGLGKRRMRLENAVTGHKDENNPRALVEKSPFNTEKQRERGGRGLGTFCLGQRCVRGANPKSWLLGEKKKGSKEGKSHLQRQAFWRTPRGRHAINKEREKSLLHSGGLKRLKKKKLLQGTEV